MHHYIMEKYGFFYSKSLKKYSYIQSKDYQQEFKGSSTVKVIQKTNDVPKADKTQFVCNVTRTRMFVVVI